MTHSTSLENIDALKAEINQELSMMEFDLKLQISHDVLATYSEKESEETEVSHEQKNEIQSPGTYNVPGNKDLYLITTPLKPDCAPPSLPALPAK